MASRLSRTSFKTPRTVSDAISLFFRSIRHETTASGMMSPLDTVWMQLQFSAIGVAKEHGTEIFEMTTLRAGIDTREQCLIYIEICNLI